MLKSQKQKLFTSFAMLNSWHKFCFRILLSVDWGGLSGPRDECWRKATLAYEAPKSVWRVCYCVWLGLYDECLMS